MGAEILAKPSITAGARSARSQAASAQASTAAWSGQALG
jgi:hypothetical protein